MFLIRKILLLAVLLIPTISLAQNYQCVQESAINYFTNKDHYLRAIRIDSVRTINGNKVLYPFKTARGNYYNKLYRGGSWLGATITILPDYTHHFNNYVNDTVVIKASATLNDSWVLYDDTSVVHYEATVTAEDTMTVLGTLDSVKTITITAKDTGGVVVPDIYNGKVMVLSKNKGFVRCFDVYNFPSQLPRGFDYYSHEAGGLDFNLVSFHNPTKLELHDYQPGDRFQRWDWTFQYSYKPAYTTLLVLDRVTISPTQNQYRILKTIEKRDLYPPYKKETILSVYTLAADTTLLFDMKRLPEEWGMTRFMNYNPVDSDFCFTSKSYSWWVNHVYFFDSPIVNTHEPCGGPNYGYKLGSGEISWSNCVDPSGFNPSWTLEYVNKNNNPCGPYFTLSVDKTQTENDGIKVYPNPANNYLSIETDKIPLAVHCIDVTGRVVKQVGLTRLKENVDIRDIPAGMFLLKFRDGTGNQWYQKLLIQH